MYWRVREVADLLARPVLPGATGGIHRGRSASQHARARQAATWTRILIAAWVVPWGRTRYEVNSPGYTCRVDHVRHGIRTPREKVVRKEYVYGLGETMPLYAQVGVLPIVILLPQKKLVRSVIPRVQPVVPLKPKYIAMPTKVSMTRELLQPTSPTAFSRPRTRSARRRERFGSLPVLRGGNLFQ